MIDFTKQLKKKTIKQRINPIEIYDDLDRNSEVGPLRPSQENILNDWDNSHRYDHDLLIKLHTGEGKTLIGLLILLSTMNEKRLPCIYLCPNRYLVDQVFWDADKFGIPTCLIDYTNNRFPQEFLDANSILITTAQKLFNGRSIFKTGSASLKVESIVLDDSHACIAAIEEGLTIKIPSTYKGKSIEAYTELKDLFSDSLKMQGAGSYLDLNNEESDVVIPIPYWSWNQKVDIVTEVLSKYSEEDYLLYIWPLYRDSLRYCEAFICSKRIEIKPFKFPIEQFGTFSRANQRILMSATTQNDSFFIKGFNFSPKVIKSPLTVPDQRWSGEKMVIIPSMVSEKFNRETVLDYFFKRQKRFGFGVVSLIPSYSKKYSEIYRENEAIIIDGNSITVENAIKKLKGGEIQDGLYVLVNRYDGIDLPDRSCRILIIDSTPISGSLSDRYEERCRINSNISNIKIAQKIEQGYGRSVRGEKDFSIIIFLGADLVKFICSKDSKKYLSPQTLKQIEIGKSLADLLQKSSENNDDFHILVALMNQFLQRDQGWKDYYAEGMDSIQERIPDDSLLHKILVKENDAETALVKQNFSLAQSRYQEIIDLVDDPSDKGWYLQKKALASSFTNIADSDKYQVFAYRKNSELLKPRAGINYTKLPLIPLNQIEKIIKNFTNYENYDELRINVEYYLEELYFGNDYQKFEASIDSIGNLLGFNCQRPDKSLGKGPDNLWHLGGDKFLLFECKNEVKDSRSEISKSEAGQMNQHLQWFMDEYPTARYIAIWTIPTNILSHDAYANDKVKIMSKPELESFKTQIKIFIHQFSGYILEEITPSSIQSALINSNLDIEKIQANYVIPFRKRIGRKKLT